MATAKPDPPESWSGDHLVLIADGRPYVVEAAEAPPGFRLAWKVSRVDRKLGPVSHVVSRSAAGSYNCDCDGFKFRQNCRHVAAARNTRLHLISQPAHRPPAGS